MALPAGAPTSATSASGTWLQAVPRNWRTASTMPFIPCRYASDRCPPDEVRVGMPVRVCFRPIADGVTLAYFERDNSKMNPTVR